MKLVSELSRPFQCELATVVVYSCIIPCRGVVLAPSQLPLDFRDGPKPPSIRSRRCCIAARRTGRSLQARIRLVVELKLCGLCGHYFTPEDHSRPKVAVDRLLSLLRCARQARRFPRTQNQRLAKLTQSGPNSRSTAGECQWLSEFFLHSLSSDLSRG